MELQRPLAVITPTVDGDVLAVLAGADAEFTPPQVHQLVDRWSVDGVRKALDRLVSQGIVLHRVAGRAGLYQLNREHLAAQPIVALALLRDELIRRLQARVASWPVRADYAALFGSAARGDMRPESDIDIFVVRPDEVDADDDEWRAQVSDLERDVAAWTGNDARTLEFAVAECRAGLESGDAVLDDVAREGLRLAGPASLRALRAGNLRGQV